MIVPCGGRTRRFGWNEIADESLVLVVECPKGDDDEDEEVWLRPTAALRLYEASRRHGKKLLADWR